MEAIRLRLELSRLSMRLSSQSCPQRTSSPQSISRADARALRARLERAARAQRRNLDVDEAVELDMSPADYGRRLASACVSSYASHGQGPATNSSPSRRVLRPCRQDIFLRLSWVINRKRVLTETCE